HLGAGLAADMSRLARTLSFCFAAGAAAALLQSLGVVAGGELGLHRALGVSLAPALTREFLYRRVVWGGLWGGLLALPSPGNRWIRRGVLIGMVPALAQLLVFFPYVTGQGFFGLELGAATPLVVVFWDAAWGLPASGWHPFARGAPGPASPPSSSTPATRGCRWTSRGSRRCWPSAVSPSRRRCWRAPRPRSAPSSPRRGGAQT